MSSHTMFRLALVSVIAIAACKSGRKTDPAKLTKADLDDTAKLVLDAYPAPFDGTFKKVVDKLGKPGKSSDNMFEWFTHDGGPCWELGLTKADKGAAAVTTLELDGDEAKACH